MDSSNTKMSSDVVKQRHEVGIYGWRKRCLYTFILFLFLLVTINVTLTAWIIRVVDFSINGLGSMDITTNGLKMDGDVEFLRSLYTSRISAPPGTGINIESSRNIVLKARNRVGKVMGRITIEKNRITMYTDNFSVKHKNKTLYRINAFSARYGVNTLSVTGGAVFRKTVETPSLQSPPQQNLTLLSRTESVNIKGTAGVNVSSHTGSVYISSNRGVHLSSINNAIRLDARNIYIYNLKDNNPSKAGKKTCDAYQICMCKDGRLFAENADVRCGQTSTACKKD